MTDLTTKVNNWAVESWENNRSRNIGEGLYYTTILWNSEAEKYELSFVGKNGVSTTELPEEIKRDVNDRFEEFDNSYEVATNVDVSSRKLHAGIRRNELILGQSINWSRTPTVDDISRIRDVVVDETICSPSDIVTVEGNAGPPPVFNSDITVVYETDTPHEDFANVDSIEDMAKSVAEGGNITEEEYLSKEQYTSHYHLNSRGNEGVSLDTLIGEKDILADVVTVDEPLNVEFSGLKLDTGENTLSLSAVVFADCSELY